MAQGFETIRRDLAPEAATLAMFDLIILDGVSCAQKDQADSCACTIRI